MTLSRPGGPSQARRPRRSFWLLAIATALTLLASPTWARDTSCRFRAAGLTLNFGALDPSSNATITKPVVVSTTNANMAGDCTTGPMTVSMQGSTSRQLVNGANTINYTFSNIQASLAAPGNSPPGQPNTGWAAWFTPGQFQGVIQGAAYADAPAGNYTDSITITVTP